MKVYLEVEAAAATADFDDWECWRDAQLRKREGFAGRVLALELDVNWLRLPAVGESFRIPGYAFKSNGRPFTQKVVDVVWLLDGSVTVTLESARLDFRLSKKFEKLGFEPV